MVRSDGAAWVCRCPDYNAGLCMHHALLALWLYALAKRAHPHTHTHTHSHPTHLLHQGVHQACNHGILVTALVQAPRLKLRLQLDLSMSMEDAVCVVCAVCEGTQVWGVCGV